MFCIIIGLNYVPKDQLLVSSISLTEINPLGCERTKPFEIQQIHKAYNRI
jgi:hypothetical protein